MPAYTANLLHQFTNSPIYQFTNLPIHQFTPPPKMVPLTHPLTSEGLGRKKLYWQWQILLPPSCFFVMSGSLALFTLYVDKRWSSNPSDVYALLSPSLFPKSSNQRKRSSLAWSHHRDVGFSIFWATFSSLITFIWLFKSSSFFLIAFFHYGNHSNKFTLKIVAEIWAD